jgi:hypothetical protein
MQQPREAYKYARFVNNRVTRTELLYELLAQMNHVHFEEANEAAKGF